MINNSDFKPALTDIVLDNMFHFVGLLDLQGRILYINRTALEAAGVEMDDLTGTNFWDSRWFQTSEAAVEQQKANIQRALKGEFIREDVEVWGKNSGKEKIIADYSLKPIFDSQGTISYLLAEGRDITDKKSLETELERKNKYLEELIAKNIELSNQQKNFFSNISHELKTPLSLIMGNTDLLLTAENSQQIPPELTSIRRNALSMLGLVEEMLELSQLDEGQVHLNLKSERLSSIIDDVTSYFYTLAKSRNIQIVKIIEDDVVTSVDRSKLEHAIVNLISNSFHIIPDGGKIECILAQPSDKFLTIDIIDNGPGITDQLKNKIFERFQTGNHQFNGSHSSTGLGLAIVKEYCLLHGGDVTISDVHPYGTRFTIKLPISESVSEDSANVNDKRLHKGRSIVADLEIEPIEINPSNVKTLSSEYLLVVDDNKEITDILQRSLSSLYDVVVCHNGKEAVEQVQRSRPLLVLTDLMMPVMSGQQLINKLKGSDKFNDLPIIALSAKKNEEERIKLLSDYVDDYITKPFFIPELISRVRNTVDLYKAKKSIQEELSTHNTSLVDLIKQLIDARKDLQKSILDHKNTQFRLNAMYNSSNIGIAIIDTDYYFVDANPYLCELLEFERKELLSRNLMELTYADDQSKTNLRLEALIEGTLASYNYDKRFISRTGKIIWTTASAFTIPSNDGGKPLLIGIIQDITEKVEIQRRLEQSKNDLEQFSRLSTLNEFATSIAHELNQPLSAIVTNSRACEKWLNKYNINQSEVTHSLNLINSDASRASDIISTMRSYLKKSASTHVVTDLAKLIQDVEIIIQSELKFHNIQCHSHNLTKNLQVSVDPTAVKQVFLNILLNAIQALKNETDQPRIIDISIDCKPDEVEISISDNGPGIEKGLIESLFKPFSSTSVNGLGLGLSICQGILEKHNSFIRYRDNEPKGAVFTFTLPK